MIAVAFRLGESRSCVHCPHYPIHPRSQRLRSSCRGSSTLSFRLSFNFSTFPHAKTNDFFGLGGCCCAAPLGLCRCRHRQWAGWRSPWQDGPPMERRAGRHRARRPGPPGRGHAGHGLGPGAGLAAGRTFCHGQHLQAGAGGLDAGPGGSGQGASGRPRALPGGRCGGVFTRQRPACGRRWRPHRGRAVRCHREPERQHRRQFAAGAPRWPGRTRSARRCSPVNAKSASSASMRRLRTTSSASSRCGGGACSLPVGQVILWLALRRPRNRY